MRASHAPGRSTHKLAIPLSCPCGAASTIQNVQKLDKLTTLFVILLEPLLVLQDLIIISSLRQFESGRKPVCNSSIPIQPQHPTDALHLFPRWWHNRTKMSTVATNHWMVLKDVCLHCPMLVLDAFHCACHSIVWHTNPHPLSLLLHVLANSSEPSTHLQNTNQASTLPPDSSHTQRPQLLSLTPHKLEMQTPFFEPSQGCGSPLDVLIIAMCRFDQCFDDGSTATVRAPPSSGVLGKASVWALVLALG
jgi:hypothetical protein